MDEGWRAARRAVDLQVAEADAPRPVPLLEPFDREQGWRGRGEQAIRDEMDRACKRRGVARASA